MGTDLHGNKYFEKAADPSVGRRKAARYFEPVDVSTVGPLFLFPNQFCFPRQKNEFEAERSPEWEAWLRGRRAEPPTQDEMLRNKAFMEMKQQKAKALEDGQVKVEEPQLLEAKRGPESFPTYGDEYEISAGYKHRKR